MQSAHRMTPSQAPDKTTLPTGSILHGSLFPPLALHRPLQVFPKPRDLYLSTPLTFSPHTLLKAVLDTSLQAQLRHLNPDMLDRFRVLEYILKGQHQPTSRTRDKLLAQIGPLVDTEKLARALDGLDVDFPLESQWTPLMNSLPKDAGTLLLVAEHLHRWDADFLHGRDMHSQEASAEVQAMIARTMKPSFDSWNALNAQLDKRAIFPVDSALQVMARLELQFAQEAQVDAGLHSRLSTMLLQPMRRPIGHWFSHVVESANVRSLAGLSRALLRKGTLHLGRPISESRIKQWSSSTTVAIPVVAAQAVLEAVPIETERSRLEALLYAARFLTFVVDVVWAGTEPEIEWGSAQSQVQVRYESLYKTLALEQVAA
jgi:hypothetical protein